MFIYIYMCVCVCVRVCMRVPGCMCSYAISGQNGAGTEMNKTAERFTGQLEPE